MTPLADGLHPVLHRERYDAIERTNISWLQHFALSPAHALHALTAPPEDTDPMRLGRVVHVATFEPERFRNLIAVWDGGRRYGKDWDAFCDRNEDKELLTVAQYETCQAISAKVRSAVAAQKYLQNGRGEVTMLWNSTAPERGVEIPCKGRIDFDHPDALLDLKTTKCGKQDPFARQVFGLQYHAKFAWYSDGYYLATGKRKPFVVIAVDSKMPHNVTVYRVTERHLELGRAAYTAWLDQFVHCRETNNWPGYVADGVEVDLPLPPWLDDGKDPTGLGLDFEEE